MSQPKEVDFVPITVKLGKSSEMTEVHPKICKSRDPGEIGDLENASVETNSKMNPKEGNGSSERAVSQDIFVIENGTQQSRDAPEKNALQENSLQGACERRSRSQLMIIAEGSGLSLDICSQENLSQGAESFVSLLDSDSESGPISGKKPLVDPDNEDELIGSLQFVDRFSRLYGDTSPAFFAGTLEAAAQKAFSNVASVADRRLLALYLHHPASLGVHVFCSAALSDPRVVELLASDFVLWGWDIGCQNTKRRLIRSCSKVLGRSSGRTMNISKERLPAVVVVSKVRGATEIRRVVHGTASPDELLEDLRTSLTEYRALQEDEAKEERARRSRERLRSSQDLAYQESLEVDRAKVEEKRRKLEEKIHEEEMARERDQKRRAELEAERRRIAATLSDEPSTSSGAAAADVIIFKFQPCSSGSGGRPEPFQRAFLHSSTVGDVLDFLLVRGYFPDFRALTGWPRVDLSRLDRNASLGQLGLARKETVLLQKSSEPNHQ